MLETICRECQRTMVLNFHATTGVSFKLCRRCRMKLVDELTREDRKRRAIERREVSAQAFIASQKIIASENLAEAASRPLRRKKFAPAGYS